MDNKPPILPQTGADLVHPPRADHPPILTQVGAEPVTPVALEGTEEVEWVLRVSTPERGWFTTLCAVPNYWPDLLVGPGGCVAKTVRTLGFHNKLMAFEGFGEYLPDHESVALTKTDATATFVPPWATLFTDPNKLILRVGDVDDCHKGSGAAPGWDGQFMAVFESLYAFGGFESTAWTYVQARNNVAYVELLIGTKNRREITKETSIPIECGYRIIHVERSDDYDYQLHDDGKLTVRARFPRGGLVRVGFWVEADTLDEKYGKRDAFPFWRWGRARDWNAPFCGVPLSTESELRRAFAAADIPELSRWSRPYVPAAGAGQGGDQPHFGPSFFLPVFGSEEDYEDVVEGLIHNAADWFRRPVFVFSPRGGAEMTPATKGVLAPKATTDSRQWHTDPYWQGEEFTRDGQDIPEFQTRDPIYNYTNLDEEHRGDAPVVAAYAMTGLESFRFMLKHFFWLDMAERGLVNGWSKNPRAIGRTVYTLHNIGLLLGETVAAHTVHYVTRKLDMAIRYGDMGRYTEHGGLVQRVFEDDRNHTDNPAWRPWEQAHEIWAFSAWGVQTGDATALEFAYWLGMGLDEALIEYAPGKWNVAYCVAWKDGASIPQEVRDRPHHPDSAKWIEVGGDWLQWSLLGLFGFAAAAKAIGKPLPERTKAALRYAIANMPLPGSEAAEINQSLYGLDLNAITTRELIEP